MWLSVSTFPPQGFMQLRSSPSKTKDPYPQLHMEGVGVDGVKSSLAHVSKIHDLINLMSLSPPPPPSLKENRCWPPPNLRLISSNSAALQCPMIHVYQQNLGTSCNITTTMHPSPPPLTSKRSLFRRDSLLPRCSTVKPSGKRLKDSTNNPSSYLRIPLHCHHLTMPPSESLSSCRASGGVAFFMRPRSHSLDNANYDHLPGCREVSLPPPSLHLPRQREEPITESTGDVYWLGWQCGSTCLYGGHAG